jgi:hypothetical protein
MSSTFERVQARARAGWGSTEFVTEDEVLDWIDAYSYSGLPDRWQLIAAGREGFPVYGRRFPGADRERIPLDDWHRCEDRRVIGLHFDPPWHDRVVRRVDLEKRWPRPQPMWIKVYTGDDPPAEPAEDNSHHSGGRPPKFDWDLFWVEVAHYAALNDLPSEDRPALYKHMMDYCSKIWGDCTPADSTVRAKLAKLYKHIAAR